ncbi:MAG TPA: asparagine synthase C-terminal domain-containing protein [Rubrivivax sp.]|nr:asparagine synthase C-terminal domain-containing protein [Rubrivivax sp.]
MSALLTIPETRPLPCTGDARWPEMTHRGAASAADWRDAVLRHGPAAAAERADGGFAVAVDLGDDRIFLAVDRFAEQTLCYRVDGGRLQVATRADLLAGPGDALDHQALFDYLYFHSIPAPRTVFVAVRRLPAGHCAVFQQGKLTVSRYWTPAFRPLAQPSFDALRDEFLQLLREAVRRRLGGEGQVACFLSGGTDSSTVAGLIGEVTGQPASTYSIGFEAQGYDEMAYARIAARRFGTDHHEYYVTPDDLLRHMPEVAAWQDQPFGNSSVLPSYCCARVAHAEGVRHLVAGDGGDELFGGNARYATQRMFGVYEQVPSFLRRGVLEPVFGSAVVGRTPLLKFGSGYIRHARTPMPDRIQGHNLLLRLGARQVLTPGFLAGIDAEGPLKLQREVWRYADADGELDRTLAYDWRFTLAESDLPKVRDATRMAGIDVAFPLIDRQLLEFSLKLPASYKLRGMKLRWFFKEALRGFLPDEILSKKKHGFGLPFGVWAVKHAGLRALAEDALRSIATRGLVRRDFVDPLLSTHLPAHPGYYGEMVWILTMLELWLRRHQPEFRVPA